MGRTLGDPADPLLVSVRSGAKFSMPGMMETVLNVGLNDESWPGSRGRPAATTGSPGTPTGGSSRCSARPSATCPATNSTTRSTRPRRPRASPTTCSWTPTTCGRWSTRTRRFSSSTPGTTSRRTRASSSTWPSRRSSGPGTPTGPCSTAGRNASPPTSAPRSTWSRWSSATSAPTPAPASPSPATRPPASRASTATTWRTPRARTWSPASATPAAGRPRDARQESYDELLGDHGHPRGPLPRPVRHRVHHRARQAVDAADPGRQAHRRRPPSPSPRSSSTRA